MPRRDPAVEWFEAQAEDYRRRHPAPADHVDDVVARLRPGSRVLDVGCGPGREAAHLARLGFRVVGLDAAPSMLELARREAPQAEFVQADLREADFPAGSFDAVLAMYSLIFLHDEELDEALRRCARWLAPGGWFLVAAQGGPKAEPGERDLFRLMERDELALRLSRAGLEVVERWERPPTAEERQYPKLFALGRKG